MADYDSPWKEALDVYLRAFLAFFFPHIHDDIDWSRGYEFLDKELQKIAPKAARGRFHVDKLVKVWRKNGRETWVLIHIEVQTQRDRRFPKRLFDYNRRISDRYNRTVVSLAVLADDAPRWRPDHYDEELWGCSVGMRWRPVKLLDYAGREDVLETSPNPFAQVVLAHLKALETRRDPAARRLWKGRLVRGLYERGWDPEDVRQLFRVIDWLMELPPVLELAFRRELDAYQERQHMPYVTSIERQGMVRMIESTLRARFGEEGARLIPAIIELNDAEKFLALNEAIVAATSLDDVRRACAEAAAPAARRKKGSNGKRGPART
ncbi:MAG TPA: hypothetical protein VKA46_34245 [Gemmataceae bacterium]|nr:hypothetical protein [Gemmataceae bacterium]